MNEGMNMEGGMEHRNEESNNEGMNGGRGIEA